LRFGKKIKKLSHKGLTNPTPYDIISTSRANAHKIKKKKKRKKRK
jgi:hypothetical protein